VPAAIVGILVVLVAGFAFTRGGGSKKSAAGEIFLEPVAQQGPAPFTPSAAAPPPVPVPAPNPAAPDTTVKAGTTAIQSTSGSRPGLYGGTRNNSSCDKTQLASFLQANPAEAAAFASVAGITTAEVPAYITKLTPVILRGDTRVTNHGFANGKATPRQTVLQAGTAVLADDRGVPRVRCACGNPLAAPAAVQTAPTYTGKAWSGFSPTAVDVVAPSPQPLAALVLSDPVANTSFARPVGTDGKADGPPGPPIADSTPTPATTTTSVTVRTPTTVAGSTTTSEATVNVPRPNADATKEGGLVASSTFSSEFPASLAIDGDPTTSWFSKSPGTDGSTTLTWTGARNDLITEVRVVGNAANSKPELRKLGFGSVMVEVLDEFGDPDFSETVQLPGSPDPDVLVRPGVQGKTVRLTFRGHEDPSRGGVSEVKIGVTR
jgi:hypothetical protein